MTFSDLVGILGVVGIGLALLAFLTYAVSDDDYTID